MRRMQHAISTRLSTVFVALGTAILLLGNTGSAQVSPPIPPLAFPTPEEVAAARVEASNAIYTALRRFSGVSKHAHLLEDFNTVLEAGDPPLENAEEVMRSLSNGQGHLALPEYIALRDKMFLYVALLRTVNETNLEEKYTEHLLGMRAALVTGDHDELTQHYRWLALRGLAAQERWEVLQATSHNNVVLRISSNSGNKLLPNPYTQSFRQTTNMEGSPATITGKLTAYSSFYKPANGAANHAGLTVRGVVNSNVAMSRPRISATAVGTTNIYAQVLLEVHNNEFRVAGSTFTSRTNMCLGCVDTASRCRAVDRTVGRLAGKVFDRKRGEINSQADQQIVAQGKPEMMKQVELVVAQINVGKQELFAPMVAYGIMPEMYLGSDSEALNMEFRAAAIDQLAAPGKPPAVSVATSQIALHDSAANNFGAMFAGVTVDEQRFREAVFESIGFSPVEDEDAPGGEIAHEVKFNEVDPISTHFEDGLVKVSAKIDSLFDGQEKFEFEEPVTVNATYRFETTVEGIQFVRESLECENVEEPNKAKFEETLGRFFIPVAEQDEITTLGQMLALLQLKPGQPTCEQGWLQMPLLDR